VQGLDILAIVARKEKLKYIVCEICGENNISTLHKHHIVPRTDVNSDNSWGNLAVLCSNCHNKIHHGTLKIIGVYPSTKLPYKRTVIFEDNGISNVPQITEPYYVPKAPSMRIYETERNIKEESKSSD
jgi:hypothetical protein